MMHMLRSVLLYACLGALSCVAIAGAGEELTINADGRKLIEEARQAYDSDMRDRPVLNDPAVRDYLQRLVNKLMPPGARLPEGVTPSITVVDSPTPERFTYIDGHLVLSTGLIFGMENEAQLAGMLAPQIAHLTQGYYLALFQQMKAAQRSESRKAVAGALFGVLLDTAVDYAVDVQSIEMTEQAMSGEATYGETMKRLAAVQAGQQAYYGIKDVVANIPSKDSQGRPIDPRLQFEPMADAQGLIYMAQAGYDPAQSARGCDAVIRLNQQALKEKERMLGAFAEQLRQQRSLMEANMARLQQHIGLSGLVQTPSHIPPSRSQFLVSLLKMKEIQSAAAGRSEKGVEKYRGFLAGFLVPKAQQALEDERYEEANRAFSLLYNRGVRTAPVAYGLAKSRLGDFAFGASRSDLKTAEKAYREALRLDPSFAEPYRGLAELYSDTDQYEQAVEAWRQYLKHNPGTSDRRRIERRIKRLKRKAQR